MKQELRFQKISSGREYGNTGQNNAGNHDGANSSKGNVRSTPLRPPSPMSCTQK